MLLSALDRSLAQVGTTRRTDDCVLVACSGGADSVALAGTAAELLGGRRVYLGHFDHGARRDSNKDSAVVEAVALALGASFVTRRGSLPHAGEAELREARYRALEEMRSAVGASSILVAHTRDDQAETALLSLIRTGRLVGMPKYRDNVVRPFLEVSRESVRSHVLAKDLPWIEDPSNAEPRYLRNRIRKELLPLLESRYRPRFAEKLVRGLTDRVTRMEATKQTRVEPKSWGLTLNRVPVGTGMAGPSNTCCWVDARMGPLTIRTAAPGDRIRPLGLGGTRKLQDVFTDAKIPREVRWSFPVVSTERDEIVWVPGLVRSDLGLVQADTQEVWVVERRELVIAHESPEP